MRSFMREKKIYCGKHYREVDIYPYTAAQLTASTRGKRSKKIKETEPKQKNLNDKNARRYFTQTANLNFGSDPEALHVTATYSGNICLTRWNRPNRKQQTSYAGSSTAGRKRACRR